MAGKSFENLEVYRLAEDISERIWSIAKGWDSFSQDTIGRQMVRSADSIGSNIAEGYGRGSFNDNKRFVRMARGSLYETRHWLRRAFRRALLSQEQIETLKPLVDQLGPRLNAYLRSIGTTSSRKVDASPHAANPNDK